MPGPISSGTLALAHHHRSVSLLASYSFLTLLKARLIAGQHPFNLSLALVQRLDKLHCLHTPSRLIIRTHCYFDACGHALYHPHNRQSNPFTALQTHSHRTVASSPNIESTTGLTVSTSCLNTSVLLK